MLEEDDTSAFKNRPRSGSRITTMGRRKLKMLCKFVVGLSLLICGYYLLDNCRNFALDLSRRLDNLRNFQDEVTKALKSLNDVILRNENKSAQLNQKKGDTLRENLPTNRHEYHKDDVEFLLEKYRKAKSERRKFEFDDLLKNMTGILAYYNQKREKNNISDETMQAGKQTEPSLSSSTLKPFTTIPTKNSSQSSSKGRGETTFLREMKEGGIQYNTGVFYPKGQRKSGIFYREALPPKTKTINKTVFLLHDKKYNSELWVNIGTLYEVAMIGFRVIAVDLPGYGLSKNTTELGTAVERARFLAAMMLSLASTSQRFLVSPGESGIYSVPMIMSVSSILKGVVFVAPNFTSEYSKSRYERLALEALVLFGQNDSTMLHVSSLDNLEHLINRRIYAFPGASHNCYVDQPETFHRLLKRFLLHGTGKSKSRVVGKAS